MRDGRLASPPGHDGTGATAFIPVPFIGPCTQAPPPPVTQLMMVTARRPCEIEGECDAIVVTGSFGAAAASAALAEISHALSAEKIEPYQR
jgi:hypothetical protein